jgi:hypothetical protein
MREDAVDYSEVDERSVVRASWSPAQVIAVIIGIAYIVLGGVALARTGFHTDPIPHTDVAGLGHTVWLGLIELVFGVIVLGAGALPGADRGGMIFAGVIAIAGGLIIAIQPSSFARVLGVDESNGILYVITGAILFAAAMLSPIYSGHARRAGGVVDRRDTRVL